MRETNNKKKKPVDKNQTNCNRNFVLYFTAERIDCMRKHKKKHIKTHQFIRVHRYCMA